MMLHPVLHHTCIERYILIKARIILTSDLPLFFDEVPTQAPKSVSPSFYNRISENEIEIILVNVNRRDPKKIAVELKYWQNR